MLNSIVYQPIGTYHSLAQNRYDVPRQAKFAQNTTGYIELLSQKMYEQAIEDLGSFSHIWVIFAFHLNTGWKPKVMPPRGSTSKVGVFASRSPHRPNNIGISAVELYRIEGLKLYLQANDLLDETPILDIKPYIAKVDSIAQATTGWLQDDRLWQIERSLLAQKKITWLEAQNVFLTDFLQTQLEAEPLRHTTKRIRVLDETLSLYCLAYRTWRIHFRAEPSSSTLMILDIVSGYSESELASTEDPYHDKHLHKQFIAEFAQ